MEREHFHRKSTERATVAN